MSTRQRTSLIVLAVAAFVAGILFTTMGANLFGDGSRAATPAQAQLAKHASATTTQETLVEPSAAALSLEQTFVEVAERVNPAVVQIRSEKVERTGAGDNPLRGTPFENFFGENFNVPQEFRADALGSGVIISDNGYIITNHHVIDGADALEVKLFDGTFADAEIVGTDQSSDLAVIKINRSNLPTIPYGDVADVRVGQWVLAFGSPFSQDLSNSVTVGIVSAIGRTGSELSRLNMFSSFIQTDAAINPGNSGGALVNLYGQLVGINSAILSRSGGNQGVGLAIPVDVVENVISQLIDHGAVRRGFLGVTFDNISPALSRAMNVPRGAAQVTSVVADSPADKAGLEVGDVIAGIDGSELADEVQLRTIIGNHRPGDTVALSIIRDERRRDVEVTLALRDPDMLAEVGVPDAPADSPTLDALGLSLGDLSSQALEAAGIDASASGIPERGAIVTRIDQTSPAYRDAELRTGDIITEVGKQQISGRAAFEQVYRELDSGDAFIIRASRVLRGPDGMETQSFLTALTKP